MPDEVLEKISAQMKHRFGDPNDVAKAVLFAVTQPIDVNIAEIAVRPPMALNLPH